MTEAWLIIVGSLVHELYSWTGDAWIVGIFTPIDESLWEHFKLGYAALLLWIPLERRLLHRDGKTYAFARGLGLIVLNLVVVAVFFGVRPFVSHQAALAVDIGSYVLGALVMGQIVRNCSNLSSPILRRLGVPMIVVIGLTFAVFTIWKPDHLLFIEHAW